MNTQTSGVVLLAVAGALLWSAWALVVAGVLLIVAPEVAAFVNRRRLQAAARRTWDGTPYPVPGRDL